MSREVIIAPLLALLKSRKFLVAAASLLAYILTQHIPALAGQQNTVAGLLVALAGLVIGGITLEDAARNIATGPQNWQDAVRDLVGEALNVVLEQVSQPQAANQSTPPAQTPSANLPPAPVQPPQA